MLIPPVSRINSVQNNEKTLPTVFLHEISRLSSAPSPSDVSFKKLFIVIVSRFRNKSEHFSPETRLELTIVSRARLTGVSLPSRRSKKDSEASFQIPKKHFFEQTYFRNPPLRIDPPLDPFVISVETREKVCTGFVCSWFEPVRAVPFKIQPPPVLPRLSTPCHSPSLTFPPQKIKIKIKK